MCFLPKLIPLNICFKFPRLGFHLMNVKCLHNFHLGTANVSYLANRDGQVPKFWVCGPGVSLCGTVLAQGYARGLCSVS